MRSFGRLLNYIKPYWFLACLGPFLMFIEVSMDLLQPTIMQHMIDNAIANNNTELTIQLGISMIIVAIIGLIGGVGCSIFSTKAAVHFSTDIRKDVFNRIVQFSSRDVDRYGSGKLITIVSNDISVLQRAVLMTLKVFVRGPLLFIGSVLIVFFTARELFPIVMIAVPILFIIIIYFTKKSAALFEKVQVAIDGINTRLQENLAGIRVVKAFGRENFEMKRFAEKNNMLTKVNISAEQLIALMMPLLLFIVNLGIVAALWLGVIKVDGGTIEVGAILAFINYMTIIMNGLMSSSHVLMLITRAFPSANRIQEVLTVEKDMVDGEHTIAQQKEEHLLFKDVAFSYSKNGEYVLKNINFTIQRGKTLGIIGPTGSGKTTIAKLIPRLYDVDHGQILLNGVDIKSYTKETLRKQIGFVSQRALLFSGTIADNLKDGRTDASLEEMKQAANDACAVEFIDKLDEGYEYEVAQGGKNFSGGQRQRLSIARAFIRKPDLLILDDSTSAVDALSEKGIQHALNQRHSTKVIISSKISSIREADEIIVLHEGEIVAKGNHETLLEESEVYKEIYQTQGGAGHE